ncbi:uncharacterized protein [Nicotiana sylvestris]|uniref:uncharacterized protein n=1 Tax=Nicotiana sylvestris TaxID=4096 RepID=UPI00388CCB94
MARKMKSLEQSLKNMQGLSGQKSVSYSDLGMFPHGHVPVGFKMPKFEKYDGHGDPVAHLKRYCNQLRGSGGKEELLMAYFGESLTGITSEWYTDQETTHWHVWDDMARDFVRQFQYNMDIAPNINTLSNLKKNITKSFREYAVKWREQAARVKPSLDEVEMVTVFLQAQEADYFQNIMADMGRLFAEAIKIGEIVENGLKTGRILSHTAFKATSQAAQNVEGLIEVERIIFQDEEAPDVMNNLWPAYNIGPIVGMICEAVEFDPALKAIAAIAEAGEKPENDRQA